MRFVALKILLVGINYVPEMIGCARYTADLAAYMAERGSKIEVVTAPPHYPGWKVVAPYRAGRYRRETIDGISVTRCPIFAKPNGGGMWRMIAPLTFGLASAPAVLWRAWRFKPDVILCVVPTLFTVPASLLAGWLMRARVVLHVQDLEIDAAFAVGHLSNAFLRRGSLAIERLVLRAADAVVSISARMCEAIADKGVRAEWIVLIRNWVDTATIHPHGDAAGFRHRHAIPDGAFVAMYAGHIGVKQALDVLLDAARLCQDDPRLRFVIVGDGPLKAPLMLAFAGLPNVQWLPLQPEAALCDMLNAADVHLLPQKASAADLVLPSKLGGMLACGKPIIAAADPGTELHDLLQSVATLIPPDDAAALAAAVTAEQAQPGADRQRAARLLLARQWDRGTQLQKFHDLLSRLATAAVVPGPAAPAAF